MKLENLRLPFLSQRWLVNTVQPYTLVNAKRIRGLYNLVVNVEKHNVIGDYVECGVYNGGTAAILAFWAARSRIARTVWLFDSFEGMPQVTQEDGESASAYVGSVVGDIEKVHQVLIRVGANLDRVRIVKGWFQDTFPSVEIPRIALLNIDADWYESVKLCLEKFYDAIVPGGIISIDDYGHWPGCKRAVDDFLSTRGLNYPLHRVDYTAHWFRKE